MSRCLKITFEDNGQDFLRWYFDMNSNKLVGSEPFQLSIWEGAQFVGINRGVLNIITPRGQPMSLVHCVAEVEVVEYEAV